MTDSNHAPLTERERVMRAGLQRIASSLTVNQRAAKMAAESLAAADAILADPTYARTTAVWDALRELLDADAAQRRGEELGSWWFENACTHARALLDGDKP